MLYLKDRTDAGRRLSQLLTEYKGKQVVVYGLPRGGVVVEVEIARYLHAPLDLILAHKIGHPYQPEYAIGAVSESGHEVFSSPVLGSVDRGWLDKEKMQQIREIKRRREYYLHGKKADLSKEKIAILVDDGIATGLTMRVGIEELKDYHPKKIVVAVPMAPRTTANLITSMVDEFVALEIDDDDEYLGAVGAYYQEFSQTEDQEVIEILEDHAQYLLKDKERKT